jgi:hypothetical protein
VIVLASCCTLAACSQHTGQSSSDLDGATRSALYASAANVVVTSCSFIRCHDPTLPPGGAGLIFQNGADIRLPLVGVTSCEYDAMNRVEAGEPENSWLMVKLTAPRDASYEIQFTATKKYTPHTECGTPVGADGMPTFGFGMPATGQFQLDAADIDAFRQWIAAGAPGP